MAKCKLNCKCGRHKSAWNKGKGEKCKSGCKCWKHKPQKCPPNCTCAKHKPCPPDCKCNRHKPAWNRGKGKKCLPGCNCWRHTKRIPWNKGKPAFNKGIKCLPDCKCKRHTPTHLDGEKNYFFGRHDLCGEKAGFFGHHHSDKTKEILSEIGSKRTHTEETKKLISAANQGISIEKWNGFTSELKELIRKSTQYLRWRKTIFERDLYICQNCGSKGCRLHVDHIKPFSIILYEQNISSLDDALNCQELWNLENGRTLCVDCHKKTDTYGTKIIDYKNRVKSNT